MASPGSNLPQTNAASDETAPRPARTREMRSAERPVIRPGHRPRSIIRTLANTGITRLIDIITPPVCLHCHTPMATQDTLCPACWSAVDFIRPPLCDRLGIPLPFDAGTETISAKAVADPPVYGRARAVARYDSVMRDMVRDLKFHDRHDARKLFGRWLTQAGLDLLADTDILVPIPLHRLKLLKRRFNQSAILAAELARCSGHRTAPMALKRTRATAPQFGLTAAQRQTNVRGAFCVPARHRGEIKGRRVLLIDDVITTGATVTAATRALFDAGAETVDVLALAITTDTSGTMAA